VEINTYVNTRAGEAAIAGTTPDMIAQYQQELAQFEEATKLDRMALQKVTAERALSEIALERAEGLLDTKFEDLTTGGAPAGGTGTPSGGGRRGGGAGRSTADGMDQAAEATERAKTALESYAETAMKSGENIEGALAGEQAAILQRGERVLSRAQNRAWEGGAGAQINIYARDAQSFRQSRTQVATDIARAVSAGRRGM